MRLRLTPQRKSAQIATNLSNRELLREAQTRLQNPSAFMTLMLQRFEQLVDLEERHGKRLDRGNPVEESDCPVCGAGLLIEAQLEQDELA